MDSQASTHPMLDLSQFSSLDDALSKALPGDRYRALVSDVLPTRPGVPITLDAVFFQSVVSRSLGLHLAIADEIGRGNPHAVFPLMRALAEDVVLVIYVIDHPDYIYSLTETPDALPEQGRGRVSVQKLISNAATHAPGFKSVYKQLCEAGHFGSLAMWASHSIADKQEQTTIWTTHPRWRSTEQALIACAQVIELADAMEHYLREFAERHVKPSFENPRRKFAVSLGGGRVG